MPQATHLTPNFREGTSGLTSLLLGISNPEMNPVHNKWPVHQQRYGRIGIKRAGAFGLLIGWLMATEDREVGGANYWETLISS